MIDNKKDFVIYSSFTVLSLLASMNYLTGGPSILSVYNIVFTVYFAGMAAYKLTEYIKDISKGKYDS